MVSGGENFGQQFVYSAGVAISATIDGHQTLSGGDSFATVIEAGGAAYISSGGVAQGTRVLSSGNDYVGRN